MTNLEQLNMMIDSLVKCETNQRTAIAQNTIVTLIDSLARSQFISCLDLLVQRLSDFNFTHIFRHLFSDSELISKFKEQLLNFLISKFSFQDGKNVKNMNPLKKYLLIEFLLNNQYQEKENKTFACVLIETKCRKELNFCYSFLWTMNQNLCQMNNYQLQQLNMNELSLMAIQIIKSWSKLPVDLVDQALRFINVSLIKKLVHSLQNVQQARQIMTLLLQSVQCMLKSQDYKIGNTFTFLSLYLQNYQKLSLQLKQQTLNSIILLSVTQIQEMFPNLSNLPIHVLQTQIEKLQQLQTKIFNQPTHLNEDKMKDQAQPNILYKSSQNINQFKSSHRSIQILIGISSFISNLFITLTYNHSNYQQLIQTIKSNNELNIFKKIFQLLSFCNHKSIFNNFIQVHKNKQQIKTILSIQINLNEQQLMKQIVRNCPSPVYDYQSHQNNYQRSQQKEKQTNVIQYLQEIVQNRIHQGKITQILQLIKQKIEKQYDQAFNQRQFESACNILAIVFRSVQKITKNQQNLQQNQSSNKNLQQINSHKNQIISKDQIIQWIKSLLNLNESCLPKNRKIIISKIYQILSQVYPIILPNNQYLQQVIENQLIINSYPQKKVFLQKLISFYEKYSNDIFEQGYRNKISHKKFIQNINLIFSSPNQQLIQSQQNQKQQNILQKDNQPQIQLSHSQFRKYKLLDRIYKKIQYKQLTLKDRMYLWKIIIRIYKIQPNANRILNIKDIKKMFSLRPQILFARHLTSLNSSQNDVKQVLRLQKKELQKVSNHFKEYPFFYEEELRIFNQIK